MEYREEKLSRAISASSRRQILRLLSEKEFTVKEIASKTQMSVSLASRHLKMLYDLGFLSVRKKFPNKFYSLKVKELKGLLVSYDSTLKNLSGKPEEDHGTQQHIKVRRNGYRETEGDKDVQDIEHE